MKKGFFPRLAASNIKKNSSTYIPYILTCILTAAMFYIVKSLTLNPGMSQMFGGDTIVMTLELGCNVIALFAFIFLFYTNSFLIKRRKKEFGVFNILGMEKRHLSIVLGWETLFTALISLAAGLAAGIAFDKAMFLLICKIMGVDIVLGFFISPKAVSSTISLFSVIYLLILVNAVRQVQVSNPVELLRAGSAGEKEPKTKWLMAGFGTICVGTGYFLAITTENPVASIFVFFIAVILVIIGTYCLFTAGSIAVLKMLRKNKAYYYKTKHFTSIAGMIYRMKQNAVGLANICILSTMVLVMVSATSSMVIGMEDIIHTRYPADFTIHSQEMEKTYQFLHELQQSQNLKVENEVRYTYLDFAVKRDGDQFIVDRSVDFINMDSVNILYFVQLSDYNAITGENKSLKDNEILLYSNRVPFDGPDLELFGKKYHVAERLDDFFGDGETAAIAASTHYIVVPDQNTLNEIYKKQKAELEGTAGDLDHIYRFDSSSSSQEQKAFYSEILKGMEEQELNMRIECREEVRVDFAALYGGFFFIGIFLAVLFIMATVLIIYYKQISEGYDDKERYEIMQKVGMSRLEVKSSIRSQVLTVFFLPLIAAGIHVAAAFPLMTRILAVLNFVNVKLYTVTSLSAFIIFAVMYVLIYALTARTYYKIVSR